MAELDYTELIPEDVDAESLKDRAFDRMADRFPGWVPSDAQLDVQIIESVIEPVAELFEVATDVAASLMVHIGTTLHGLPPREAFNATADTTWTTIDTGSYVVPEGTQIGIAQGLDLVAFATMEEVTLTGGSGTIPVQAVEPGAATNGLDGTVTLIDPLAFVDAVTLDAPTAGGVDAETTSEYLVRLVELLRLMSPRPILPAHFEVLARQAGAYRAVAVEGLDPIEETEDNPLTMTVAVMDAEGEPLTEGSSGAYGTKAYVLAEIQKQLMANSVVHIIDPDYTEIDVTTTITSLDAYIHGSVVAAVEDAIRDYLAPINWGRREGTGMVPTTWVNTTTVRYLELAEVINRVPGVDYIDTLTFNADGDSPGTTDITIDGYVPLTRPGSISVT